MSARLPETRAQRELRLIPDYQVAFSDRRACSRQRFVNLLSRVSTDQRDLETRPAIQAGLGLPKSPVAERERKIERMLFKQCTRSRNSARPPVFVRPAKPTLSITGMVVISGVVISGTAVAASLDMPPVVPQPSRPGDLVGFNLQNTGSTALGTHLITFGQAFEKGAVMPGTWLLARDTDANRRAQLDTLATYPDGSVRFGAITMRVPQIAAFGALAGILAITQPGAAPPVDLTKLAPKLTVQVTLGTSTQTVDLGMALQQSIAAGTPDYWLRGPCATQARIDLPISGSFHITADITGYADGSVAADVQFNNDLAMGTTGGAVNVSATISLNGITSSFANITQRQYQDWHIVFATNGAKTLNVQHDVRYLEHTGAILPYDLTTGVADTTLQSYATTAATAGFDAPLAANGVTQYMPTTGGRPDIGYTTQYDTVWLLTQDARAAQLGLAQGDAAGAVPWNLRLANGRWLTPADYPTIWSDGRGGPGSYTTGLTQQIDTSFGWTPDPAHEPNLGYVPYLMTAARWYLDRLNAEAAYGLSDDWPSSGVRCVAASCDIVVNNQDQVRQQAWALREIEEAAAFGRPGSFEATYFAQVAADNWAWVSAQEAAWTKAQGQAAGYLSGAYGSSGTTAEWEQDYLSGIAVLAAEFGDAGAAQFVSWQRNWILGRFTGLGMNPHDGCTYNLAVTNPATGRDYPSWSSIESATVAAGLSNGKGWANSNGDYCQLARAVLGGLLTLNASDSGAQTALAWLKASGAPLIDPVSFQNDPTFNVVPLP